MLDVQRDRRGVLSYTVAVRSLDGAGPQRRGVAAYPTFAIAPRGGWARCVLPVRNTGAAAPVSGAPGRRDRVRLLGRLPRQRDRAERLDDLAAEQPGHRALRPDRPGVGLRQARRGDGPHTTVNLTVKSESDPTKTATTSCRVI